MPKILDIIDAIDEKLTLIPLMLAGLGFVIGYLIAIIPIMLVRGLSLVAKLAVGQGFNEMAFDCSHPEFDVNSYLERRKHHE